MTKSLNPTPPAVPEGAYFEDPDEVRRVMESAPVVCIGTFDGIHRGQQAIVNRALAIAKTRNTRVLAITFHPHPKSIVATQTAPLLLTEPDEKTALLKSYGVDLVLQLRFDRQLAAMSSGDFLNEMLLKRLGAASIVIGHDFGFGKGREGTPESLQDWGRTTGCQVEVVQAVIDDSIKQRISSSLIRENLTTGHFDLAVRLLGHPYPVSGQVVPGAARGRQLGYPTWNICLSECKLPPPAGIYAGWAGRRQPHLAMVYYGSNPTFAGEGFRLEANLLELDDPQTAIPDRVEAIWLAAYVRPEVRFESADVLIKQLADDERVVRDMMSTRKEKTPQK